MGRPETCDGPFDLAAGDLYWAFHAVLFVFATRALSYTLLSPTLLAAATRFPQLDGALD